MSQEQKNAKQFAQRYFCKHMVSGVVGYENEKILVSNEAIQKMNGSFSGKPVYVNHQKTDLENLKDADGYVVKSFYNEADGWFWAEIIVVSDAGHEAIKNAWKVSNAYIPLEWGAGGQYLNVDYNRKIENGEFTHLAIVPNPRYEESIVLTPDEFKKYQDKRKQELEELHNEKTKGFGMLKFFKAKKEEVTNAGEFNEDTLCPVGSKHVPYSELVNAYEAMNKNKCNETDDEEKEETDNEDEVDGVDKKKLEVVDSKKNKKNKKNADDEADKSAEDAKKKEDKEKENEEDKEEDKEEEKENAKEITQADLEAAVSDAVKKALEGTKNFEELRNANSKKPATVDLSFDKAARGKERY